MVYWRGEGRGLESSPALRRSSVRCAATLAKTANLLVAVASPGMASISGDLLRRLTGSEEAIGRLWWVM
jgi:hypothetical protein